MENNDSSWVPNWKLRRMVPRALRVLGKHKDGFEELKTFELRLVSAAQRFVEVYDASRVGETPRQEVVDARKALRKLELGIRRWTGILTRDIPGFTLASFLDGASLSDDLIGGAKRFLDLVRGFKTADGEPLEYVANIQARVTPLLAEATCCWEAAQDHMAAERELLRQTREAAAVVQKELVALRRTLKVILGATHRDYQVLRLSRVAQDEDEIDTDVTSDAPSNDSTHDGKSTLRYAGPSFPPPCTAVHDPAAQFTPWENKQPRD
ncbi:MAG TPA: hypothetical protein VHO25_22215, partial [Polyangiaceae bacterium]|nr:hypothetical protein [Polyangiaceae bacterium]